MNSLRHLFSRYKLIAPTLSLTRLNIVNYNTSGIMFVKNTGKVKPVIKKTVLPPMDAKIRLYMGNEDLGILTYHEANKRAKSENLKLILSKDAEDTYPIYKLMTLKELGDIENKSKKKKRDFKMFTIKGKIDDKDFEVKMKKVEDVIKKDKTAKIFINSSEEEVDILSLNSVFEIIIFLQSKLCITFIKIETQ